MSQEGKDKPLIEHQEKEESVQHEVSDVNHNDNRPGFIKKIFRESLAEFAGTFILILIGCGSNAQGKLTFGNFNNSVQGPMAWAAGIFFGVLASVKVSGAHLNPAVTISLAWHDKFDWGKVPFYCCAQFLGAFLASFIVFLNYYDGLDKYADGEYLVPPAKGATAGIFGTFPNEHANAQLGVNTGIYPQIMQCLFDQIMGTAFLLFVVCAVGDERGTLKKNAAASAPWCVALAIYAIGSAFGYNCGYAVNPARDLGPRVMSYLMGYKIEVFTAFQNFFWVPIAGPIIGGIFGSGFYLATIGAHNLEIERYKQQQSEKQKNNQGQELQELDHK